jgi:nucleoid DNA-binding protein
MTKAELVDQVAATVQLSKVQTDTVLTQCLQTIMDALQAGESVELRGFGRFQLRHRPPRAGRNPPHGRAHPDSGQSRPHVYRGESLSGTGAIQRRACGRGCVRPADAVPVVTRQEGGTPAPRSRALSTASLRYDTGDTGARMVK